MSEPVSIAPEMTAALLAASTGGWLRFDAFMQIALFHPTLGYYQQKRPRVGRSAGTDFYTATSSGSVFGELICASAVTLLQGADPKEFTFVEIGAETPAGILTDVAHPFGQARVLRLGDPLTLTGRCVVFSNELFDAQPCRSFVFRENGWHERGVAITPDGTLAFHEQPLAQYPIEMPADPSVGYQLDLPLASIAMAEQLAAQPWSGLFIACDYGKSWAELSEHTPQGTLRAYRRHRQSNELLAHVGQQDITCHVCWDWLVDALARHRFASPRVDSQESFFIKHAGAYLAQVTASDASHFTARKMSILQLLHPANLGQKFQVLHARRLG